VITDNNSPIQLKCRIKPYPSYKDSGVEWLGKIPAHWMTKRIKYVAPISNERVFTTNLESNYLALEHIESGTGKLLSDGNPSEVESTTSVFRRSDVLFGKLRPYLAKVYICESSGNCSTELLVFRSNGEIYPPNLAYQVRSQSFIRWVDSMTYGTKMPRLSPEQLMNIRIAIPPPDEQRTIADLLDRETAKIDALLEKKERLIELLQEKRSALITQAVTKGLDPTVPMKDSGIDWLGKIPAHWEVKMLKWLGAMRAGVAITSENIEEIGQYPVYGGNGIRGYATNFTHEGQYPLVGRQGALCGCVNFATGKFWASEHAVVVSPRTGIDSRWLNSLLQSMALNTYSQSAAQPGLAVETIGAVHAPYPPEAEQRDIADYIFRGTARIDALIVKISDAIARLKEYRIALISAAVTGKIDVRTAL